MSISSKSKRDKKKKAKIKQKNQQLAKEISRSSPRIEMPTFVVSPNPFESLTEEEKQEALEKISSKSQKGVQTCLEKLNSLLRYYAPLPIIAMIAECCLQTAITDEGSQRVNSTAGIEQAHVELLQALMLKVPVEELGQEAVYPHVVQDVIDTLSELVTSFRFSRIPPDMTNKTESEKAIYLLQERLRGHTQVVRNWGSFSQVITISKEVYSEFDSLLFSHLSYSATNILTVFETLVQINESNLNFVYRSFSELHQLKKAKDVFEQYQNLINDHENKDILGFIEYNNIDRMSVRKAVAFCKSHYDLRKGNWGFINVEELAVSADLDTNIVESILQAFSLDLGSLNPVKSEHLFLNNPIWHKPVIAHENHYFCILPQLFFSFVLQTMDEVIELYDKNKLHKQRAIYLEKKIEQIVKTRFPDSNVVSGIKWKDGNRQYETDLIMFIDSHAIIVEAKSHRISKQALRGELNRAQKHLNRIFFEPAIQSYRLEQKLIELKNNPTESHSLRTDLPIDIDDINKIVRVSVSLEDFATLQSNLKQLTDTGWVKDDFPFCPSINLGDFETIFDLLEHPIQIIHYLTRRQELEDIYQIHGDELDFLGFYIVSLRQHSVTSYRISDTARSRRLAHI